MRLFQSAVDKTRISGWASKPILKGETFDPFVGDMRKKKKRAEVKNSVYMWEVHCLPEPPTSDQALTHRFWGDTLTLATLLKISAESVYMQKDTLTIKFRPTTVLVTLI